MRPFFAAQRSSQRGFSLIEVAIVLGVIGLVLGGIFIAAGNLRNRWRTEETVTVMNQAIERLYQQITPEQARLMAGGGALSSSLTAAVMNKMGIFPVSWYDTACSKLRSPFGTSSGGCSSPNIVVSGGNGTMVYRGVSGTGITLAFTLDNLSVLACTELANSMLKQMQSRIYSVAIGDDAEVTDPSGYPTLQAVVSACSVPPSTKYTVLEPDNQSSITIGLMMSFQ